MGSSQEDLVRIATHLLNSAPFVDFNCGCPSPTVVGNGSGSALLQSELLFSSYVGALAQELGKERMSVKMRTGFSTPDEFEALAGVIARHAPRRVTVHGRTRAQRYLGRADWTLIGAMAKLVEAMGKATTVVGSGDIVSPESHAERAGIVRGNVIIGRGALRNPWIFSELPELKTELPELKTELPELKTELPELKTELPADRTLSRQTLLVALQTHALLQHLHEATPQSLIDFVGKSGLFLGVAGRQLEAWIQLRDALATQAGFPAQSPENWLLARGAFSKVKMIWNSMRSGLPEPLFSPEPLRAPDLATFLARVQAALETVAPEVVFRHHEHLDWVYSGGKESA
jgi:tRNA-dihydrouridine synthase